MNRVALSLSLVLATLFLCVQHDTVHAQQEPASRGWIGVSHSAGTDDGEAGVEVWVFPESPAEEAGIRSGDRIVRWNGDTEVARAMVQARVEAGDTVRLRVRRNGQDRELLVVATQRPAVLTRYPFFRPDSTGRGERDRAAGIRMETLARALGESARVMQERSRELESLAGEMPVEQLARVMEQRAEEIQQRVRELEVRPGKIAGATRRALSADSVRLAFPGERLDSLQHRLRLLTGRFRRGDGPATGHAMAIFAMRGVAGAELEEMNPGLARYFGTDAGLLVLRVSSDTPAHRAGLEAGDVVTAANDRPIRSVDAFRAEVTRAASARARAVELEVLRKGEKREMRLTWE